MAPAFATRRQALVFCGLVGSLLALPAALRAFDLPPHEDRLPTAPILAGPYSFLQHEIYDEDSPIDLAIVGDSLLWVGMDTPAIARALSHTLGRDARVLTFGWNWRGDDITYYVLRDLFARRRVGAVMLRLPQQGDADAADRPHPQSFRWLTACAHDPVPAGLPWSYRLEIYGVETVGAPRNLFSLLRPNLLADSPYTTTLGAYPVEQGPRQGPFTPLQLIPNDIPLTRLRSTLGAQSALLPDPETHGPFQRGYDGAIRALLETRGVPVIFVRAPFEAEARRPSMPSDGSWAETFGQAVPVLAPSPAEVYAGLSDAQIHQMYYDGGHFNRTGAEYLTATIMPAILEFYADAHATR